jgi:hypothetical protein
VAKHQILPFVAQAPSRDNPLGEFSDEMRHGLSISPASRPGGSN